MTLLQSLLSLGGSVLSDLYYKYVTVLLHGDGTNGGQNNTFLDSSTNNFTITRNGNTTQGSFSPFSRAPGYWSNYFDGSSSLTVPAGSAFAYGTGDFTVECWFWGTGAYGNYYGDTYGLIWSQSVNGTNYFLIGLGAPSDRRVSFTFATSGGGTNVFSSSNWQIGQWNHIAAVRSGSTVTVYLNGQAGTGVTCTQNFSDTSYTPTIGRYTHTPNSYCYGYISNLRVVKGTAVYTSNFTPSTTPLTAISGTSLLTCQSNRFVDNSSNAFTVTPSGASIQTLSPFGPTSAYSAATNGGSGYFDGSTAYLTVPSSSSWLFNGDACLEAWVYMTSASSGVIFATGNASSADQFGIFISSEGLWWGNTSSSSPYPPINQWAHCVVTRSGSTIRRFINGVLVSTGTNASAIGTSSSTAYIGQRPSGGTNFTGYMSGLRVINGSIPTTYQTSSTTANTQIFTPPSAPATTSSEGATSGDVKLLVSYQNGSVIDNASTSDLLTVGTVQTSTTQSKFGGSSLYFNGSSGLTNMTMNNSTIKTGDFTVEFWMYPTSSGATQGLCCIGNYPGASAGEFNMYYNVSSNGFIRAQFAYGTTITGSSTIVLNTWTHVAVSRYNGTLRLYINGNLDTSASSTDSITTNGLSVGQAYPNLSQEYFTGYIDDFRVTQGIARYIYNFTPPSAAYYNQGYSTYTPPSTDSYFGSTSLLLHGDGTNGGQNNTFLDGSTNALTITQNGNASQGSFSPFSRANGYWSNYFNGSTDYLATPSNSAFTFGSSGDFTIEAWIYMSVSTVPVIFLSNYTDFNSNYNNRWALGIDSSSRLALWDSAGGYAIQAGVINTNSWYHVAICRSGSTITMYLNGQSIGTYSGGNQAYTSTSPVLIGHIPNLGWFNGYISNVRIVKGTAVYTSNFTPSTTPLTAITNTSLLTCQSNRLVDNSTNAFSITPNGGPANQTFIPFEPTAAYSAATNGGSGYFDGSTAYLTTGTNSSLALGTNDFTVEYWIMFSSGLTTKGNFSADVVSMCSNASTGYPPLLGNIYVYNGSYNYWLYLSSNNSSYDIANQVSIISNPTPNIWYHVAITRSGNTFRIFNNGSQVATFTSSASIYQPTNQFRIGYSGVNSYFPGYLSDLRLLVGTALYTSAFTPPTAPLTAITNTKFVCNFQNANIVDSAATVDLQTVGNAQTSTAQSKFGGTSMYFDGSASYINFMGTVVPSLGDFTVEFWLFSSTATSAFQGVFDFGTNTNLTSTGSLALYLGNTANGSAGSLVSLLAATNSSSWAINVQSSSGVISNSAWMHFAIVRSGGSFIVYINGNAIITSTAISATTALYTGNNYNRIGQEAKSSSPPNYFSGYIDDLRVTNGICRYPYNFTIPASAYPNN